ncbi:MAG: glycosyltransferase family 2 protein, partial [Acidobacteriota bacterium]|nr:glycosyltransferase family 2 protein [Acidobacteriota bacterium]
MPARNEEQCLGRCLESLVAQQGIRFEILVVDDGSSDRTHAIAESFAQAQVMDAGALPQGWTGKNHAAWQGAQKARGRWLLFTDADTVHEPGSLAAAVAEAEQHGAALLSYSPRQEVEGFWEKALMPVVFADLARTYPPSRVSDPQSPVAAANGQYLMISREAYDAVGGHRGVAGTLLEDVAIARRVKESGRVLRFRYGGEAVRTRMYRSLGQMWEGWTKNLALLFPHPIRLAVLRGLEFLILLGAGVIALGTFWLDFGRAMLALLVLAIAWIAFLGRIRRAHFGAWENDLALFGLPLFAVLLVRSQRHHRSRGSVEWKGRTYPQGVCEPVGGMPAAEARPL